MRSRLAPPDPLAARIEVSRGALHHNIRVLRALLGPDRQLAAVIKANAYGHGRDLIADLVADELDVLAVAEPIDALAVAARAPGRVLCMGPAHGEILRECVARGVRVAVSSMRQVDDLSANAVVHVLVDTGLHRLGVAPQNAHALVNAIRARGAHVEAAFTMVVRADHHEWDSVAAEITLLRRLDLGVERLHTGGSSVTLDRPDLAGDIGRVGIALYGHHPPPHPRAHVKLMPSLRLLAPVLELRLVTAGDAIGYQARALARDTLVATLPVGTVHGLHPGIDERFGAILNDTFCQFLCPPTFEYSLVDATDAPSVDVGDSALVLGGPPGTSTSADDIAAGLGITAAQMLTALAASVPRVAST
jgi:alanine racemase